MVIKYFNIAWFVKMPYNGWHMSSGGFRSESLSTEAEIKIEVLTLATHKPRYYLYAVLALVIFLYSQYIFHQCIYILYQILKK